MLPNSVKTTSKSKKSTFRKVSEWLHLWLGLFSGIIVFVVCLTGAIWLWRYEVFYFTEKYQRVQPQQKPFLPPSVLILQAKSYLHHKDHLDAKVRGITYGKPFKSVIISLELEKEKFAQLYLNPYTGLVLKDKREPVATDKFFLFVRAGHRFFWLPRNIGSPLVGSACLIFLVILITGLIWWYPKKWTAKTKEKSFKIKWTAKWKRLNIDLHNVLGFYATLFILAMTISGIVFTFEWFEKSVYTSLTWKSKPESKQPTPLSDTTITLDIVISKPEDVIWRNVTQKYGDRIARVILDFPEKASDPYQVMVTFGKDEAILYNRAFLYYDQSTLKELKYTNERDRPYEDLSLGEKVFRMNYDIHTGQILGLPSKIIAFFACVIGASLPVTGVIIWYNRKWGKKKQRRL